MESSLIVPVLLRLSLFLIVPVIHWSFHRLIEHGIASAEKLDAIKGFMHRFRFVPDLLLIAALVGFRLIESSTEH